MKKKSFSFEYTCLVCERETEFTFYPGYFHPCSNPDCPGYSDPGEPDYVEPTEGGELVCKHCGAAFNEDGLMDYASRLAADYAEADIDYEADFRARNKYDY